MKQKIFFSIIGVTALLQVKSQTITTLTFPYVKGYHMFFSGTETQYSKSGSKTELNSQTIYDINSGEVLDGMQTVTFNSKFITGKDTSLDASPLALNENGMFYWWQQDGGGYGKPVCAIKLPLTANSTWKTNYGSNKAVCRVVSLNTKVKTPDGEVDAFCIETRVSLGWQNGYEQVEKLLDYYNMEKGKVAISISFFWQSKDGKKIVPTMSVNEVLQTASMVN